MIEAFIEKLARQVAELSRTRDPTGFAVAFSGGQDSAVLLAGCARLELPVPVRALHVNHRLHADADHWAQHCAAEAERLGLAFDSATVRVPRVKGHSLEAAARERRYAAFADRLRPGEMLLTAHHADDQLETVLLRLLRGAGVRGLCGILPAGELGAGFFGRPLLETSKADIAAVAQAWNLHWIEDPSNLEQRFDRNYLRRNVVPRIRARWPSAGRTVGRTAQHMRDAQALLDALAAVDAAGLREPQRMPLDLLRRLDAARRRNVVRAALAAADLPVPTTAQLRALFAMIDDARHDSEALVRWPGAEARLYRGHLYLIAELPARAADAARACVTPTAPWSGPEGDLVLVDVEVVGEAAALADDCVRDGLEVRFRLGGERFKPAFGAHHRKLKTLFQEAGIVPWMRERIPLLYRADSLVAVGDLWISDDARARDPGVRGWRVRWSSHPALH